MILSIKIKDNIHISREKGREINFGGVYFEAQGLIKDVLKIDQDTKFEIFANAIFDNFKLSKKASNKAYNLYYHADPMKIAKSLIKIDDFNTNYTRSNPAPMEDGLLSMDNYLNYFGFAIAKFPTKAQFAILNGLKASNIIENYWIEGETFQPDIDGTNLQTVNRSVIPNNLDGPSLTLNQFEIDLNYNQLKKRGAGATIITFEESATNDLSIISGYNTHLQGIDNNSLSVSTIGFFEEEIGIRHQLQTLVTLFSKNNGNQIIDDFELNGICPEANLIITSVFPLGDNDYLGKIRQILVELLNSELKNAVLLFEFVTNIYDKKDKSIVKTTLPASVYKDINKQLTLLARAKNFIVIEGAGNLGINFDNANKLNETIWNSDHLNYNNLSINNPFVMMIGATCLDINGKFVFSNTNMSENFDAYMYTEYKTFGKDDLLTSFGGTSGAVAVAAGIVTYLQGRAIQEMTSPNLDGQIDERFRIKKPFTVKNIKKAFENTFKKNLNQGILLTPTTIEALWEECKKIALKH
jgi:hypothetical protein